MRKLSFTDSSGSADTSAITLNAFLTYVSLSWKTIIEAIIDNPQAPALSRAPVKPKPAAAGTAAQTPVSTPAPATPAEGEAAAAPSGDRVDGGSVSGAR